ncbi:hypothetical protein EVAR_57754_1 [Eumeta japonica]|uniref:Reverse transcriptase domain-containing protein n=1 Tax=Eumeta variegata TaxID=151549 RepID=A0A4C1ZXJ1_EUMVA|nr:hypothetical protein EVAR_57754_1 [Eumeta japonica]
MPGCHLAGPGIVPSHGEQMFAAGILSPGLEGSDHKGDTEARMLVWRIQWHIMPKLQTRQYGFMPQRGTEDSLYDLMTHIHNELNQKNYCDGVIGHRGAFDNAWWPALRNQLLVHKCPAFGDDVVLMFSGQSASALEAETNRALAHVRDWGDRNKLRFAPSKTNAMVLTKTEVRCPGHSWATQKLPLLTRSASSKHEQESHGDHAADEVPPSKGAQRRVAGRNWRPGKGKAGSGEKLAKPATLTFPWKERAASRCRGRQRHRKVPPSRLWGFAKRVSPCQPSLRLHQHSAANTVAGPRSQEGSAKPGAHRRQPGGGKITALTREARDELEALRNISREVKTSVCEKLQRIAALALSLPHHILVETGEARGLATLRRRLRTTAKTTEHHLDRCLRVETAVANMAAEIKRTQDAIDRMDIPNKLEGSARHWRSSRRPMRRLRQSRNCKRPRSRKFLAQRSPLPTPLSSRPDAPTTPVTRWSKPSGRWLMQGKWGGVDRVRKARNQKVVLTCVR